MDLVIAEYDGSGNLLRKFLYGPGIDEPICMIDVTDSNAVYYYHFDGLGSVAALSDANAIVVEKYEYGVFGEPTIYDANNEQRATMTIPICSPAGVLTTRPPFGTVGLLKKSL